MGRIVRRFARFFVQEIRQALRAGTWTVPITQTVAAQKPVEAVINANALGGDVNAALLGVVATASLTGTLAGVRPRVTVNTGVVVTGDVYGANTSISALGTAEITGFFYGMRIAMSNDVTVTQISDICGLSISNMIRVAPSTYEMIRLEDNGGATVLSMISGYFGVGDIRYFALLQPNKSAWDWAGDKTGGGGAGDGWIKVRVNGAEKFIALYN